MPQDRRSGEEASAYGHECGEKIASALGALKFNATSNECLLNGERVVVKCARLKTKSVGVTHGMLRRIDAIVGAFEENDGSYSIVHLPAEDFILHMTPTRSRGASAGRVGTVSRKTFYEDGRRIASVRA